MRMRIDDVRVVGRYRKDLGDLDALAKSIEAVGLLNPITVTSNGQLIAGQRRLEAFRLLGRDTIDALIAEDLDAAVARLQAERDENTERKQMTPEERVELGLALEELERPKAQERQAKAGREHGSGIASDLAAGSYLPAERRETREVVAEAIGMGGTTYNKAKAVVETARDTGLSPVEQEIAREALADMNATGNISGNYNKVREIRATKAGVPQRPVLADVKKQRHAVTSAVASLSGIALGLNRIEELHPEITSEEAAQWVGDLSQARLSIERLIRRLKERINA